MTGVYVAEHESGKYVSAVVQNVSSIECRHEKKRNEYTRTSVNILASLFLSLDIYIYIYGTFKKFPDVFRRGF